MGSHEAPECVICYEQDSKLLLLLEPCRHCVCNVCVDRLAETTDLCPVCRGECSNIAMRPPSIQEISAYWIVFFLGVLGFTFVSVWAVGHLQVRQLENEWIQECRTPIPVNGPPGPPGIQDGPSLFPHRHKEKPPSESSRALRE